MPQTLTKSGLRPHHLRRKPGSAVSARRPRKSWNSYIVASAGGNRLRLQNFHPFRVIVLLQTENLFSLPRRVVAKTRLVRKHKSYQMV